MEEKDLNLHSNGTNDKDSTEHQDDVLEDKNVLLESEENTVIAIEEKVVEEQSPQIKQPDAKPGGLGGAN